MKRGVLVTRRVSEDFSRSLAYASGYHFKRSAEAVGLEPTTVLPAAVFKTASSSGRMTSIGKWNQNFACEQNSKKPSVVDEATNPCGDAELQGLVASSTTVYPIQNSETQLTTDCASH